MAVFCSSLSDSLLYPQVGLLHRNLNNIQGNLSECGLSQVLEYSRN